MLITKENADKITNRDLPNDLLYRAQNIIETYVGKVELEIQDPRDKTFMGRAVAYQAAYMIENEDIVYEQVSSKTTGQNDSLIIFKENDDTAPWIAPLAVMACKKLTFFRARSIKTGKTSQRLRLYGWRRW
jgi:hypothetical protein